MVNSIVCSCFRFNTILKKGDLIMIVELFILFSGLVLVGIFIGLINYLIYLGHNNNIRKVEPFFYYKEGR